MRWLLAKHRPRACPARGHCTAVFLCRDEARTVTAPTGADGGWTAEDSIVASIVARVDGLLDRGRIYVALSPRCPPFQERWQKGNPRLLAPPGRRFFCRMPKSFSGRRPFEPSSMSSLQTFVANVMSEKQSTNAHFDMLPPARNGSPNRPTLLRSYGAPMPLPRSVRGDRLSQSGRVPVFTLTARLQWIGHHVRIIDMARGTMFGPIGHSHGFWALHIREPASNSNAEYSGWPRAISATVTANVKRFA